MKNSRKNCQKTDPHFSAEFTLRVNQSGNERSRHGLGMGWTNVHLVFKNGSKKIISQRIRVIKV